MIVVVVVVGNRRRRRRGRDESRATLADRQTSTTRDDGDLFATAHDLDLCPWRPLSKQTESISSKVTSSRPPFQLTIKFTVTRLSRFVRPYLCCLCPSKRCRTSIVTKLISLLNCFQHSIISFMFCSFVWVPPSGRPARRLQQTEPNRTKPVGSTGLKRTSNWPTFVQ